MKNIKQKPAQNMKDRMRELRGVRNGEMQKKSGNPFRRLSVMVTSVLFSASVFAYYCPPFNDMTFGTYITQHYTTLASQNLQWLSKHDQQISNDLTDQRNDVIDAIKVLTKQKNVVGNAITDTMTRTTQSQASTYQAFQVAAKQKDVALEYGATGQGYKNCGVLAQRNQTASNQKAARDSVVTRISTEVKAAPGTYADPIKAQKEMLAEHNEKFCTPDQQASNLCGSGSAPGLSLQAATLFTEAVEGTDVHQAQNALINNMVGLPDRPINERVASTPAGEAYLAEKLAKDAKISPAINSLKAIQSEFTSIKSDDAHSSDGVPLIAQFRKEVNRYLGFDEEYKEWNKALTSQEERGVLKEILQVKALKLAIGERIYRSNERKEALLASLVSMEQELASGEYDMQKITKASAAEYKQRIALSDSLKGSISKQIE
ncbi:hypothetical protein MUB04_16275 [Acinetobacter indicus]|uniref:hypothetical protein n=1 Tax=Acinetobacter TaxID=469 RepID=UPI0015D26CFB|nr:MULTISPECIES: hypothetical protein [Acinetobacter]MCP0918097.1 hypothetical protein [Acinetobacter indicus]